MHLEAYVCWPLLRLWLQLYCAAPQSSGYWATAADPSLGFLCLREVAGRALCFKQDCEFELEP
jgi:hypothetical protein